MSERVLTRKLCVAASRSFHHGDLKAALTDSAVRIVEQSGVETFSLREVARDAGVSSAAPYRHFSNKEALLAEVARRGFDQLHDKLADAGAGSDRRSSFLTRCVAYVGFARRHPALYRLMFGAFPNKDRYDDLLDAGDRLFALLNDSLAASPSNRAARAIGCWAFVHGLAMLTLDNQIRVHLPSKDDESLLAVLQPLADALMALIQILCMKRYAPAIGSILSFAAVLFSVTRPSINALAHTACSAARQLSALLPTIQLHVDYLN